MTPPIDNKPLDITAVLADSNPLAISRVAQYDTIGSTIITYVIRPPIRLHAPNSSAERVLVTINVKMIPVITLDKPMAKEINPE